MAGPGRDDVVVEWPPTRPPRRRGRLLFFAALAAIILGLGTALSYYVEVLWFDSLGYVDVLWKTLNLQAVVFLTFGVATFVVLYGSFLALKPANLGELASHSHIVISGQPVILPVEPVLRLIALGLSIFVALITAASMMAQWTTFGLFWYGQPERLQFEGAAGAALTDPIFGRPLTFYLFTLPAWNLISGWLVTLAVVACVVALFFVLIAGGARALSGRRPSAASTWRGLSIAFSALLLALAVRTYLGRYDRLFDDHTIFAGVTYTEAHVTLTGMLVVAGAFVIGAVVALINAVAAPRLRWLIAAAVPAGVCYLVVGLIGWYVNGFIVKPNELVRERPFITNNIEATRRAYGLASISQRPFPADAGIEAVDPANNGATLENIRLWDWRALQDTLRQIQEIRTYYDFPDIDIDRYELAGSVRQMMLGTRELSIDKLPESSRNWINEKLVYTHGYGVTMNPVNGFTPEGLPTLLLSNMPVQSAAPGISVNRPEIYFGELTNADVYVKTRQQEFNYPQGESSSLTSYEGTGGIVLGGMLRRILVALDRGDVAKLPFSDDVTPDSRLLMRRNVRERITALAPFLTLDPDPYIVVTAGGRLVWMMDGFTTSDSYPYARHYRVDRNSINYMRNSVKAVVDAYDGTTTLYVFDSNDPVIAAYRAMFPTLFKSSSSMPDDLRRHVRYPELLLELQATVYGLYHMTDPEMFYNREDLWTVATEVRANDRREQATQRMEPNFVLMTLPGERGVEFVEILPFTPANRNNLIGWIAGRSDGEHYGTLVAYNFPKNRLVDGPLQIEARIDQNPQLSGQFSLWNQQGSRVVRGSLLVIPMGRGLLYAEPVYLQAERSPMPELRLVVLALQDRLAYGPTFESAMAGLFGSAASPVPTPAATARVPASERTQPGQESTADLDAAIADAAKDLAEYQRLTAEGKLGEAGQRLEALKRKLEELQKQRRR
jgi:uncharacterized membrane protein (UPF0182 family)